MRTCAALALLIALTRCGPKSIDIEVNVVSGFCGTDTTIDPFMGVGFVQIRVTGPGLDTPLISQAAKSTGTLQVPQIPAGPMRVIEVRGYDSDPSAGGKVLSVGRTLPFDLPDVVTSTNQLLQLNVFLREVNSFTQPSSAANPHNCSIMQAKRAGHTATLLQDGRVYIAGGFQLDGTTGASTALSSTEFFDPSTGTFTDAPAMQLNGGTQLPKAFHTATLLPNGQVVLHGGETYTSGQTFPQEETLIFDLSHNAYGLVRPRDTSTGQPPNVGRSHHLAIPVQTGQVLLIGGVTSKKVGTTNQIVPVPDVEWFDPSTANVFAVLGESFLRTEAAGAAVRMGQFAAIAGGVDENGMVTKEVAFYAWNGTTFARSPTQFLENARRSAAAITLSDDSTLLVMGGFSDPVNVVPMDTTEAVKTASAQTDLGPSVGMRGDVCATLLAQGDVMAVGGRAVDMAGGPPRSDGSATVITFDARTGQLNAAGASAVKVTRWGHTCTTLLDGSVLVTGGVNEDMGTQKVLQDAWIYTPIPGE